MPRRAAEIRRAHKPRRPSHKPPPYRRRSRCSECPRRAGPECLQAFLFGATIRRSQPRRRRAARRARCARPGRSVPAGSCNAPKRRRRGQVQCRRPKPPSGCRTALQSRSIAAAAAGGDAALTGGPDGGGDGGSGGGATGDPGPLAGTSAASVASAGAASVCGVDAGVGAGVSGCGGAAVGAAPCGSSPGARANSSARSRSSRRRTALNCESATTSAAMAITGIANAASSSM
jgi:hypothetical protein